MKALGCVAVVLVVVLGGFLAVAYVVLTGGDDQSALTERVELTVSDPQEERQSDLGTGYRFDYAYRADGRWYGGEDWIRDNYWTPGQALSACIDPDQPQDHVITIRDERCGQESIVSGSVATAEPTTAPSR